MKEKTLVKTVSSVEEAEKALTDDIGFSMVEDSLSEINPDLYVDSTNQLLQLEEKFNCIHQSGGMTICSVSNSTANAYVSNTITHAPRASESLSLCPGAYKRTVSETVESLQSSKESKWHMPFTDGNETIYTVTHEYGHILQNLLEQQRMVQKGLDLSNPLQFANKAKLMAKTKKARLKAYDWYKSVSKEVEDECFLEIVRIAEQNNPNFKLADNLSRYGRTNKAEFFAEVFANSQLGEPNELGKAMNIWLDKKGLVKQ
jgi:hypothetical protein